MTQERKVLVVDDEPVFQRLVQHHLERAGFVALNAANGRVAIEVAERESPCVIVMDLMMEDMDGLSALKQLKKGDRTKSIPVIMVTATVYPITRLEAETSGAAAFLTKPFSPAQLLAAIRRLVPELNGMDAASQDNSIAQERATPTTTVTAPIR
jgi:CheY-like chemotaxis protein